MADTGDNSDLFTISTVPGEVAADEQNTADQKQSTAADNAGTSKASATVSSAPKGKGKNKRARKGSKAGKATNNTEQETDDINLHVEAGWSEDEKDDNDHPSKRIAAAGDSRSPVAVKKTSSHLENFTVRSVVTRKDVDVIFEAEAGKKESIEQQTSTSITIVAGKDDPEIVVDRVLSIKGHIDDIVKAYKVIAEGLLLIKKSAAATEKEVKNAPKSDDAAASFEQDMPMADGNTAAPASNDHQEENGGPVTDKDDDSVPHTEEEPAATDDAALVIDGDDAKEASADKKAKDSSAHKEAVARRVTLRMLVPHKCVGSIMGHGGKTINDIRDVSSVDIHTSESTLPQSSERIVEIVGAPESIEKAIRMIAEALTKDIASYSSADHYVPAANLPSAMTVETQSRKRKDNKRQGIHSNQRGGSRGYQQGNRGSGFRTNSQGGYGGNRHQHGNSATNHRNTGSNVNMNGNRNGSSAPYGSGRNDNRYGRQNDRQSGRGRGHSSMSHTNRTPVGANSGAQQGQYNSSSGGYRMGNQQGMHGHGGAAVMGYGGGYVMPTVGAYTGYAGQGAAAAVGGAGGAHNSRYGNSVASAARPVHAVGAYGTGGYSAPTAAYQFQSPVGYTYAPAPMPGMFNNNRPAQAASNNTYNSRSYVSHGSNRPQQMPQPSSIGMGQPGIGPSMGGSVGETAGQAIQQMYVSSEKIGAIIGRGGETINEIRRSTNARVEIQDSAQGAKKRLILITGAYEQVRSAYHIINEKLEVARQSGRT
ncbi:RNA binding protein, heterogenous nuclear RNP-K like protein [Coemansia sp. RSA 1933]|nr:RNA binding protein, heterogenous nuclear RNP-K like protein [Coemansia sp. RSA 1933]